MFENTYIKTIAFDIMFFFSIIIVLAVDGKFIFNNGLIISCIFLIGLFNIFFGFKCLSLKSDVIQDRGDLISLCSSENILNFYNFFKYTLGFGFFVYVCYTMNVFYMAYAILFFIISKFFSMSVLKNKNDEIFKVS